METPPVFSQYPRSNKGRGPGVYFEMIGEAFTFMFRNPKIYIGAGGIAVGIIGIAYVGFLVTFIAIMPRTSSRINPDSINSGQLGVIIGLYAVLGVAFFLARMLMIGVSACTVEESDTGSTSFKTLFSPFVRFFPVAGCVILSQLAIMVGAVLCYVPGLYLMGVLAFAPEICLIEKLGPIESITKSYEMIKPHAWMMVLLTFVLSFLSGAGGLACGIGLAVTFPIMYIVLGMHYREFRGPIQPRMQTPMDPYNPTMTL